MKTIVLTYMINTLFMGIVFFAYQFSEAPSPRSQPQKRAIVAALDPSDQDFLGDKTAAATSRKSDSAQHP